MILAHKLMRMIETHAQPLAETLEEKILRSERCTGYRVSPEEIKMLARSIYGHLGEWLLTRTEQDIEYRYDIIGAQRAEQGISVSQLVWCIVLVKENLWDYLRENENLENTSQVFGELELTQMVDLFFDRAIYYAVRGHERVSEMRLAAKGKSQPA